VGKLQSHGLVEEARHRLEDDDGEDLRSTRYVRVHWFRLPEPSNGNVLCSLGDVMSACVLSKSRPTRTRGLSFH
jgi:hypothetical protein